MAFDFILMLTANDRTIPDAPARLEEALRGGVRHIGFKDVGLPLAELKALADAIRAAWSAGSSERVCPSMAAAPASMARTSTPASAAGSKPTADISDLDDLL